MEKIKADILIKGDLICEKMLNSGGKSTPAKRTI